MWTPVPRGADSTARERRYGEIYERLVLFLADETDLVAAMATVACELHHGFEGFDWTGFYRVDRPGWLVVGPYQGGHGCLRIPFDRGVCGAVARTEEALCVEDVRAFPGHIACSSSTRSEVVVPVFGGGSILLGVLDVDSDDLAFFGEPDLRGLTRICDLFCRTWAESGGVRV